MRTARLGFILSMIALSCFLFACAETAPTGKAISAEKTIRIGSPFKTGHILVDAAEKIKELTEKGSGGRIAVEMQVGAKSEEEIDDLCSKGTIDMQSNGNRPLEIYAPQYFFLGAPYVLKDWDHLLRIWQGNLGKKAREQVEKNGNVSYLGIVYRGLRQTTSKKPIYTPADAYGLKLRLPVVPTWIADYFLQAQRGADAPDYDQPHGSDWWDAHPQAILRPPVEGGPGSGHQGGKGGMRLGQREDEER